MNMPLGKMSGAVQLGALKFFIMDNSPVVTPFQAGVWADVEERMNA